MGPVLAELAASEESLEVNPTKVYLEMIAEVEVSTGQPCALPRLPPDDAAKHPEVKRRVARRFESLQLLVLRLLSALNASANEFPFGVRWLCSTLETMATKTWATASEREIVAIVSGYFVLRLLNPMLMSPEFFFHIKCGRVRTSFYLLQRF